MEQTLMVEGTPDVVVVGAASPKDLATGKGYRT
jgi:hypothetical protein